MRRKTALDDKTYVDHMLSEIAVIERLLMRVSDEAVDRAMVRCLEVIGEAANQISPAFKEKYTDIAWREATDMRNALIHGYFGVNYERVYETARGDIPLLKQQLLQVVFEE